MAAKSVEFSKPRSRLLTEVTLRVLGAGDLGVPGVIFFFFCYSESEFNEKDITLCSKYRVAQSFGLGDTIHTEA